MKTSIAGSLEDWGGLKEKAGKWPCRSRGHGVRRSQHNMTGGGPKG